MKFFRKITAAVLCAALLLSCLTACQPLAEPEPDTPDSGTPESPAPNAVKTQGYADEIFSLNYDPDAGFNPYNNGSEANLELMPLIYEGLFRVTDDFNYEYVLCESAETADGKTYKLEIRKNIRFHDGSRLTPEDVAAALNTARESRLYASRLSIIAAAYVLEGSLYIELVRPNTELPLLLDVPIAKSSGEEGDPVGTGPYHYVDAGEYSYLKAFEKHRDYDALPLDRFYLKSYSGTELISAFDSGLVDLVTTSEADIAYLAFGGNTELRYSDTTNFFFLGVNRKNGFLSSANRRILLSSMLDRKTLATEVINGTATTLPLHPSAHWYSAEYDPFTIRPADIEAAKIRYMVEDYDRDGMLEYMDTEKQQVEEISLTLVVNKDNPVKVEAAQSIQKTLLARGIAIEINALSWDNYLKALQRGNYDLYYGEVMLTADQDLTQLLSYGGSANIGFYDSELQTLIYDFNAADAAHKADAAQKLYSYMAGDIPLISLMFEKRTVYTHREVVSGIAPTVHNIYNNITGWSVTLS